MYKYLFINTAVRCDGVVRFLQLHRCPDLSDFQQKLSSVLSYNEKLLKEKEALSEELNSCVEKVVHTRLCTITAVHTIMSISLYRGVWASLFSLIVPRSPVEQHSSSPNVTSEFPRS